jgi:hypothetical protein
MIGTVEGRPLPVLSAERLTEEELRALDAFKLGGLLNEIAHKSLELAGCATQGTKNLQVARVKWFAAKGQAGERDAFEALEIAKAELAYVQIRARTFRQLTSIIQSLLRAIP